MWEFVWEGKKWLKQTWCGARGLKILVGLTSLITKNPPILPKLNRRRAMFVLTKIDEIPAWEGRKEGERDPRWVELGRYLCEVRAVACSLPKSKCFDEFLERHFPESRRKAYYLMSIDEHLPPQARKQPKDVGWTKGLSWPNWRGGTGSTSIVQSGCTKPVRCRRTTSRRRSRKN